MQGGVRTVVYNAMDNVILPNVGMLVIGETTDIHLGSTLKPSKLSTHFEKECSFMEIFALESTCSSKQKQWRQSSTTMRSRN